MKANSAEITNTLETEFAHLINMVQQLDIKIPILTVCKLARIISYVHDNEMIYINKGILYCLATVLRNLNLGNMSKFPNQNIYWRSMEILTVWMEQLEEDVRCATRQIGCNRMLSERSTRRLFIQLC